MSEYCSKTEIIVLALLTFMVAFYLATGDEGAKVLTIMYGIALLLWSNFIKTPDNQNFRSD